MAVLSCHGGSDGYICHHCLKEGFTMTVNLLATELATTEKMFGQYLDTTPTENMFATLPLYHFNTLTL